MDKNGGTVGSIWETYIQFIGDASWVHAYLGPLYQVAFCSLKNF